MRLDCTGFELRLEAFLERRLAPAEHAAVAEHARCCPECRELLALGEGARVEVDVASAVLARTTGSACSRARELLAEAPLPSLASIDGVLVREHVSTCAGCAALAGVLARLDEDLPLLETLSPGKGFVEAVLARTRARPRRPAWSELWAAAWQRLVFRPRFALESAYVLTLAALLVFGGPPDLLAGLSRQVRGVPAGELPERLETTIRSTGEQLRAGAHEAWRTNGAPLALEAERSLEQAASYSSRRIEDMKQLVGTLWAGAASEPAQGRQPERKSEPDRGDNR